MRRYIVVYEGKEGREYVGPIGSFMSAQQRRDALIGLGFDAWIEDYEEQ